jgi:hypothetical protein
MNESPHNASILRCQVSGVRSMDRYIYEHSNLQFCHEGTKTLSTNFYFNLGALVANTNNIKVSATIRMAVF